MPELDKLAEYFSDGFNQAEEPHFNSASQHDPYLYVPYASFQQNKRNRDQNTFEHETQAHLTQTYLEQSYTPPTIPELYFVHETPQPDFAIFVKLIKQNQFAQAVDYIHQKHKEIEHRTKKSHQTPRQLAEIDTRRLCEQIVDIEPEYVPFPIYQIAKSWAQRTPVCLSHRLEKDEVSARVYYHLIQQRSTPNLKTVMSEPKKYLPAILFETPMQAQITSDVLRNIMEQYQPSMPSKVAKIYSIKSGKEITQAHYAKLRSL
jgi:hypothetical protein